MKPCKFQTDATGQTCLIYSEDMSIHRMVRDPMMFSVVVDAVGIPEHMGKGFAMANVRDDGMLEIGDRLDTQGW